MARPTKYTPQTVKKIIDALAAGNTRKAAGQYAGIDEATFCRWLHNKANFANDVENAEARAEVGHVANIAKAAGSGNWTASAWWLERRRHEDWGRKDKLEIIQSVRQMAEAAGLSKEDADRAVEEAERTLKEVRGAHR